MTFYEAYPPNKKVQSSFIFHTALMLYKLTRHSLLLIFLLSSSVRLYASSPADSTATETRNVLEISISAASSLVVNAAFTELVKRSVDRTRPNGEDNHSFPSRHTSWAFTASTIVSNELYSHSPWWAVGTQAAASAVGFQRVVTRHHYGSDVIAGAGLGIVSTQFSYWLCNRLLNPKDKMTLPSSDNDFRPSIAMTSEAVFNIGSDIATAFGVSLKGQLPLTQRWGLAMTLRGITAPVIVNDTYINPINAYGAAMGGVGHFRLPVKALAIETSLHAGFMRLLPTKGWSHNSYGFEGDIETALSWRLTPSFAFAARLGYRVMTTPSAVSAITFGLSYIAVF